MRGQERDHRPTRLQSRHIAIQVDAIQTLNIQRYMPIEHVVHRHRRSDPNSLTATRPADQPHRSAVRGEASLVVWVLIWFNVSRPHFYVGTAIAVAQRDEDGEVRRSPELGCGVTDHGPVELGRRHLSGVGDETGHVLIAQPRL
jgi:hypothetical protein